MLRELIIGVLASLIAGVVLLAATAAMSRWARWVLTGLLGRLLRIDIDTVFNDKKAVDSDLRAELARANKVRILTGRGDELRRDTFDPLFMRRPATSTVQVQLLVPDTRRRQGHVDWTQQREAELARFDPAFGSELLKQQIEANAGFLENYSKTGYLEVRRFNAPHIGRLVLTDRFAYFTPYQSTSHGRDNPVYKHRRGVTYDNLDRLFRQLWDADAYRTPE
jgi:hypothetical protein